MTAFFSEGTPSGATYFTSPVVNLAAEAITAEMGVLFFGSPIPKLITGSPRSRNKRASSFNAKVGDSVISLASLLNLISTPIAFYAQAAVLGGEDAAERVLIKIIWLETLSNQ